MLYLLIHGGAHAANTPLDMQLDVSGPWGPLKLMFIGAMAAVFGVFILTASDLTVIRTYIFAVLCGFCWHSVIDTAEDWKRQQDAYNANQRQDSSTQLMETAINSGNTQQIKQAVENTQQSVTAALGLIPSVPEKKTEITDSSKKAINALKNTTVTAANSGDTSVALKAIDSLSVIGDSAVVQKNVVVAQTARDSLSYVANNTKDQMVKNQALTSASKIVF